ncbi:unnamed protein product [Pieris macdunnoughi]|uniref:Uncharacterized protein n=1 Tax=Pieris macdunnoughi TaxID=345717 RepID=A0A821V4G4_9NEOP|nr:unnamed protein product [Pieris macdunnoughi]
MLPAMLITGARSKTRSGAVRGNQFMDPLHSSLDCDESNAIYDKSPAIREPWDVRGAGNVAAVWNDDDLFKCDGMPVQEIPFNLCFNDGFIKLSTVDGRGKRVTLLFFQETSIKFVHCGTFQQRSSETPAYF